MPRTSADDRQLPSSRAALLRVGSLVVLLILAFLVAYELGWLDYRHTLDDVVRLRDAHSVVGFTIGFILVYSLGTAVGMPGLPFTVAAGALYGTAVGAMVAWTGEMLGSVVGYWIARTVGHDVVVRWLRRYRHADAAIADARDFIGMLRLRLIPVLPLGTVNFVAGLARVPPAHYLAATALGIIPSTVIYCYFANSLLEGVSGRGDALRSLIIASVLLILLSMTPKLFHRVKGSSGPTVQGPDLAGDSPASPDDTAPVPRR